jgi:N-carbamoylputrescine amidase
MVRVALTQTVNAYRGMPTTRAELPSLKGKLAEIARANVAHHLELLRAAAAQGVQAICFGELFPAPYFALEADPMWEGLAEDAEQGETIGRIREAAAATGLVIVAPLYEVTSSGERFNTAVIVSEQGEILGKYRKNHIPQGANEKGGFYEKRYYGPGDGKQGRGPADISSNRHFPAFQTSVGRMGVAICYDRHFEGVVRSLKQGGAEIVFSPAVTFGEKSERLWRLEFQVDAARHRVFIGGSNRKGMEPPWTQPYFGDSHFVGPDGPVANRSDHPNLIIADLDLATLQGTDPSGWDLARDARPKIYET